MMAFLVSPLPEWMKGSMLRLGWAAEGGQRSNRFDVGMYLASLT